MPWAKGIHQPPLPPGPFRLGLGISGARARRRPARDESPIARRCVVSDTSRTPIKTHLALDILTNADVVADLAMRNSVEYRHDTPLAFPLERVVLLCCGVVAVPWLQKIDFMIIMSFSTSSKGKLAPRPQILFCSRTRSGHQVMECRHAAVRGEHRRLDSTRTAHIPQQYMQCNSHEAANSFHRPAYHCRSRRRGRRGTFIVGR